MLTLFINSRKKTIGCGENHCKQVKNDCSISKGTYLIVFVGCWRVNNYEGYFKGDPKGITKEDNKLWKPSKTILNFIIILEHLLEE